MGFGIHGVGEFSHFSCFLSRFSSLFRLSLFFFAFLRFCPRGQGKLLQFTAKKGTFPPTPSAATRAKLPELFLEFEGRKSANNFAKSRAKIVETGGGYRPRIKKSAI